MRSKRILALAGLGAGSLLSFMAACGSVNEPFVIVVGGVDAGADDGATTDASSDDAATDATVQDSGPDGSVQDASVDATVTDAGVDAGADAGQDSAIVDAGPVLADGSSVVTVGDAQVIIPPLDLTLLGDGGIRVSDGGLANADGGALTPSAFRDLVNGITCQRAQECCCPGCSAVDLASPGGFSQSKCTTGLGTNGLQFITVGNESITVAPSYDARSAANCLSLLNATIQSCQSLTKQKVADLRAVCLNVFQGTQQIGQACVNSYDCFGASRCVSVDGGKVCAALAQAGDICSTGNDCSTRGVQGTPPNYCEFPYDGGTKTCKPYLSAGSSCRFDSYCGAGACLTQSDGDGGVVVGADGGPLKVCSDSLPFASTDTTTDTSSFCAKYAP